MTYIGIKPPPRFCCANLGAMARLRNPLFAHSHSLLSCHGRLAEQEAFYLAFFVAFVIIQRHCHTEWYGTFMSRPVLAQMFVGVLGACPLGVQMQRLRSLTNTNVSYSQPLQVHLADSFRRRSEQR